MKDKFMTSQKSWKYCGDDHEAMIAAGIEAVGNVAHDIDWEDDELDASDAQPSYTLH